MIKIAERNFGCEFEFSSPFNEVEEVIKPKILSMYGTKSIKCTNMYMSTQNNKNYWHLKRDFSTSTELCTPISKRSDLAKICRIVDYLKKNEISITRADSLHVHVQANDVKPENMLVAWMSIEPVIVKCFPKYRRKNEFCEKFVTNRKKYDNVASFFREAELNMNEHHQAISFTHYNMRKTVEFRISEGTLEREHVRNWVNFCLSFISYARGLDVLYTVCETPNLLKINDLIDNMKLCDKKLIKWLRARYNKFS